MVKFLPFEYCTGFQNMARDEEIFKTAVSENAKEPVFRLYGWKPACVTLGRNQKDDFLDKNFLKQNGIDVVKRLTGGRALLHDKEITYSFVSPIDYFSGAESVVESYKAISDILIRTCKQLGIELVIGGGSVHTKNNYCMLVSTGADLTYHGKKLVGSAQYRAKGYILQHGSVLYDYDCALLEKIFGAPVDKSGITSVKEILPDISMEEFGTLFQDTVRGVLLNI